ncbi:pantoate kinase [uncultured Methanomethylovorans sp.]|uniref:pantoate kinase n=1 Tax=uncultured Methanomethylovorans sp. TaxID=183759 RepID=UPI002AA70CED|nr:pantoate kinase [uncultured Methanomethylovorans sp.]
MQVIKRSARAFAPAHITGFFCIHDHEDPRKKGSTGCGIVIDGGVVTTVTSAEEMEETQIILNEEQVGGYTTRTVVNMLTDSPLLVESVSNIPIGCGFGASAAGALSTAYALNDVLSLNLTSSMLIETAHVAEVVNRSGLGDVIAQSFGGVVIRTTPGAPNYGTVDWIPVAGKEVLCLTLGELDTGSVISDPDFAWRITSMGKGAMKKLMTSPTFENFMQCSRDFALGTGLASDAIIDAIEAVESAGGMASQAMLGESVFAIVEPERRDAVIEALSEFGQPLAYYLNNCRAGLM